MTLNDFNLTLPFRDRTEAGRILANRLRLLAGRPDVVVLALPRGGIPVGAEVGDALHAPLFDLCGTQAGCPGS